MTTQRPSLSCCSLTSFFAKWATTAFIEASAAAAGTGFLAGAGWGMGSAFTTTIPQQAKAARVQTMFMAVPQESEWAVSTVSQLGLLVTEPFRPIDASSAAE